MGACSTNHLLEVSTFRGVNRSPLTDGRAYIVAYPHLSL
jgi:hypothetical protein